MENEIAKETLNMCANGLIDKMSINIHTYFTCTLGGMVDGNKPPYPMVPVNVMEPILNVILNEELIL